VMQRKKSETETRRTYATLPIFRHFGGERGQRENYFLIAIPLNSLCMLCLRDFSQVFHVEHFVDFRNRFCAVTSVEISMAAGRRSRTHQAHEHLVEPVVIQIHQNLNRLSRDLRLVLLGPG
jgi:hypothetical protein